MTELSPYKIPFASLDIDNYSLEELEFALANKKNIFSLQEKINDCGKCIFVKQFTINRLFRKNIVLYKIYILKINLMIVTKHQLIHNAYCTYEPCLHTDKLCTYQNINYIDITEMCGNLIKNSYNNDKKGFFATKNIPDVGSYIRSMLEDLLNLKDLGCCWM